MAQEEYSLLVSLSVGMTSTSPSTECPSHLLSRVAARYSQHSWNMTKVQRSVTTLGCPFRKGSFIFDCSCIYKARHGVCDLDSWFGRVSERTLGTKCMGGRGVGGGESVGTSSSQEVCCCNTRGDFIYHDTIDSFKSCYAYCFCFNDDLFLFWILQVDELLVFGLFRVEIDSLFKCTQS